MRTFHLPFIISLTLTIPGFHRFIWEIKKLLISLNSKGMFDQITLKCSLFGPYKHRLE
jgi:hypothetical protein